MFPYQSLWGDEVATSTPWKYRLTAYGTAESTGELLVAFANGNVTKTKVDEHLRTHVVHQYTLFPVCEPVMRFLYPRGRDAFPNFWMEVFEGLSMVDEVSLPSDARLTHALSFAPDELEFDMEPFQTLMAHTYHRGRQIEEAFGNQ